LPSIDKIIAILLPAGASRSDLCQPAANALADSIENRTGLRPEILESADEIPSGWVIAVETIANATSLQQNSIHAESLQAFALRSRSKGASRILSISSASQLGVTYGMYRLADELRAGVSEQDLRSLNQIIAPALRYRLVDMGAFGILPDSARQSATGRPSLPLSFLWFLDFR